MKTTFNNTAAVLAILAGIALTAPAFAAQPTDAELRAQAKVSQDEATATALAKVPQGTIKSVELEKEQGKLVWSFDIAKAGTKGVTEIMVDALTGKIVSLKKETDAQEAKEAQAEAKEGKAAR
ncbi:MAG: peptidase [Ramlibacter sp.]|nr:peptidase [Ramlibacter sp.]